jgi:hypothetical protein
VVGDGQKFLFETVSQDFIGQAIYIKVGIQMLLCMAVIWSQVVGLLAVRLKIFKERLL